MLDKVFWKNLLSRAEKGDANAQYEVGDHYSFGSKTKSNKVTVKKDFFSAFFWYEKAAKNGVIEAQTNIADFLSEGKGCKKDINKAIENYHLAIDKGSSRAALNLGTVYRDAGNFKKAFEYYSLANKIDKVNYSFTVGLCFYYGVGVAIDRAIACKYFIKVSVDKLRRHTQYEIDEANFLLALSYLTGDGIKKSLEKSRAFLKLANIDNDHRSAEQILFIIGQTKR